MITKNNNNRLLFGTTIFCGVLIFAIQIVHGRTLLEHLVPQSQKRTARSPQSPSSVITESQQTVGSTSAFVNSTAEGNGDPGSAVAYAWQGGQTSAQSQQTATADKGSSTHTSGLSTCHQDYSGNAEGSHSANSIANALCNTAFTTENTQHTTSGSKSDPSTKGFGAFNIPHPPQLVTMNHTSGGIGNALSGQTHNSNSNINLGHMNIFAGGFANAPQGSMNFQHSVLDPYGNSVIANQEQIPNEGLNSEEHTYINTGSVDVDHNSGGLSHVQGLGNSFNTSYNSHAPEEEEVKAGGANKGNGGLVGLYSH